MLFETKLKIFRGVYITLLSITFLIVILYIFGVFDDFDFSWWVYGGLFFTFTMVQVSLICCYSSYIRSAQRRHFERFANDNHQATINMAFSELRSLPGFSSNRVNNDDRRWELNGRELDMSDPPPKY